MITKEWQLGVQDRGHDHWSYAVMCGKRIMLECGDDEEELARHIIAIHNAQVEKKNND